MHHPRHNSGSELTARCRHAECSMTCVPMPAMPSVCRGCKARTVESNDKVCFRNSIAAIVKINNNGGTTDSLSLLR